MLIYILALILVIAAPTLWRLSETLPWIPVTVVAVALVIVSMP